ncbi:MAG: phosphatase PAP2 family protein [Syntrophomonadaceae bacterium]|nr:phosphatase PAP2 family protein [Syntrophomonadaceae bacterium]
MGMMKKYFELFIVLPFLLLWLGLAAIKNFPISMVDAHNVRFVAYAFISPLLMAAVAQVPVAVLIKKKAAAVPLLYIPYITAVGFLHFNFKAWMPLVNPARYDDLYLQIDKCFISVVSLFRDFGTLIPPDTAQALYGNLFFAMFLCSFAHHLALDSLNGFRKVVVGACLIWLVGGISYWAFPALGPFSHSVLTSGVGNTQNYMLAGYLSIAHTGVIPQGYFATPPAAMPSLHIAHSCFFTVMALRRVRFLGAIYVPVFLFIVVFSVALRWHYLVDLPAGLLLAVSAVWAVDRVYGHDPEGNVKSEIP